MALSKVISGQIYNLQVLVPLEIWNYHDAMFQPPDWELQGIANPTGKKGKFGKNVETPRKNV